MKNFRFVFGGIIAVVLLGLYAFTNLILINNVVNPGREVVNDGIVFVHTTVGGLISALVIAELAITKPGDPPGSRALDTQASERFKSNVARLTAAYLMVWLILGMSALIVGVMLYPGVSDTLSDTGTTWLGLAIAAGYSYFGIQGSR